MTDSPDIAGALRAMADAMEGAPSEPTERGKRSFQQFLRDAASRITELEREIATADRIAPDGWVLVPRQPTEAMWSGLARQIVLWDRSANPRGETLYKQLSMCVGGCPVPDWLREEIPNTGQCPPKGTVAACIYKAMLDAAPAPSVPLPSRT